MDSFCMNCGKPLAPGAKFCPGCGTGLSQAGSISAPASSVAPDPGASVTKPVSAMKAILITAAIFVSVCLVGYFIGTAATSWLMIAVVVASAIWAAADSSRKQLGAAFPLIVFIGICLLWLVTFPWYLVTRSNPPAQARRQRLVVALVMCGVPFVVLGGAVWFLTAGGDTREIWAKADDQLAAAKATAETPTPKSSTGVATDSAPQAPGAKPAHQESTQPAQPEASAPLQQAAPGATNLQSCISGGQKPELACLSEELDRQDARLNKEYQRVMALYKQLGQTDNTSALRKVEVEWIKRVASDCDTTPPGFMGNPDHHRIECRLDMTKARADELAKMPQ